MKRRPFLHLAVGVAATGGCLGASERVADAGPGSTATDGATDPTEMAATDSPLSVERVETREYAVRLNDLGGDPGGRVTAFDDLDDRERDVFEAALADGYETDDPPRWLVEFASGTPYVEREATYYRLENTFPTTTVTAEAVPESDVDGEIAPYDEYEAAVTDDGRVMSGLMRIAREEGIDLTYVWDDLRAFLEDHDAVRYHGDVLSFSVAVEDPGPPYRVSAAEVRVSEAVDGEVWNASEADPEARELVREAGETRGAYAFDGAPDGLFDALDDHRYVLLDGTFYTASVEKRASVPVALDATLEDAGVGIALANEADGDLRISTGAPRPFGVLHFHPVGDEDDSRLLWTDAYEESDHVRTEDREIRSVDDIALVSELGPGETLSETYDVDADSLASGEYVVEGSVGVDTGDDTANLPYRVVFSVA
ncbi:hypothetical protein NGM10_14930 [Halorussus salilacus]|uniref:hypothetical protein n=1 Tax=Halorussus salilacus TaxID=2953750 RepID=UPI00209D6E85|nr:hypothetical protein [Halorussus salilacus]USZ68014.1 hypothetical protein NGM10_14930 [Halorussus salilacus]